MDIIIEPDLEANQVERSFDPPEIPKELSNSIYIKDGPKLACYTGHFLRNRNNLFEIYTKIGLQKIQYS